MTWPAVSSWPYLEAEAATRMKKCEDEEVRLARDNERVRGMDREVRPSGCTPLRHTMPLDSKNNGSNVLDDVAGNGAMDRQILPASSYDAILLTNYRSKCVTMMWPSLSLPGTVARLRRSARRSRQSAKLRGRAGHQLLGMSF